MIEIIIPTLLPEKKLGKLVNQIRDTAGYPYQIIHTGLNGSASNNRNHGLKKCKGNQVIMIDDDIEFPKESLGWLKVMAECLSKPSTLMVSAQLLNQDLSYAYMTGLQDNNLSPMISGETEVPSRRILTACCGFKHNNTLFDDNFIGSGFEDIDYCNMLSELVPDGKFIICHSARAIHKNEAKNQRGIFWNYNKMYYNKKWGTNL